MKHAATLVRGYDNFPRDPMEGVREYEARAKEFEKDVVISAWCASRARRLPDGSYYVAPPEMGAFRELLRREAPWKDYRRLTVCP